MRHLALVVSLLLLPLARGHAGELETLRAENARLRARVAELEAQLSTAKSNAPLAAAVARKAAGAIRDDTTGARRIIGTEQMRVETEGGVRTRHWITLRSRRDVSATQAPLTVELVIDAAASDGVYRGTESVALAVDGEEFTLPVTDYASYSLSPSRGSGVTRRSDEKLVVTMPRAVFDKLARSTEVRTKVRSTTLEWGPEHIATARALRDRLGD